MTQTNLTEPKLVVLQEAKTINVIGLDNIKITYSNDEKWCKVSYDMLADDGQRYDKSNVVLWEGIEYDNVGQFTDEMVNERLLELLN